MDDGWTDLQKMWDTKQSLFTQSNKLLVSASYVNVIANPRLIGNRIQVRNRRGFSCKMMLRSKGTCTSMCTHHFDSLFPGDLGVSSGTLNSTIPSLVLPCRA